MVNAFFGSAGPAVAPTTRCNSSLPPSENGLDTRIQLQALSVSQWRVCDTRWPEHDARSLLAFIEKRAERFDVVQVCSGLERFSFRTLAEAKRHFAKELHLAVGSLGRCGL